MCIYVEFQKLSFNNVYNNKNESGKIGLVKDDGMRNVRKEKKR